MAFDDGTWVLTPAVSYGFPTTAYATLGHSALGRHLNELRLGLIWGRFLSFSGARKAYLQGAYSYAFMEDTADVSLDRKQDENTPEDERWDPDGANFFEQVGHTLEVAFDADTFLAAAKNGDYDVLLVWIEQAGNLQSDMASLAPDAAVLPILKFPTRSVYSAARKEWGIVLKLPTTSPKILAAIEKARKSVRP